MKESLAKLAAILHDTPARLNRITEAESEKHPAPGKWSKKEILGHLIDSASNNHQRFVRAQLEPRMTFPGYEQELWIGVQHYQLESWKTLVQVWESLNRHLLHVISQIPEDKRANLCAIERNDPVTLEFLVGSYLQHLEHHLNQILG